MNLYDELSFIDVLGPIQGKFKVEFDANASPKIYLKPEANLNGPWISTMKSPDRVCQLWATYFNYYRIVPRGCRACFKVAMSVPTLRELFKVLDYQRGHDDTCKCGTERRLESGGLGSYNAIWYSPMKEGLEGARKLWKRLTNDFPTMKVILRRGCIAFETVYNPSDTWDGLAEKGQWDVKEDLLDTLFVVDPTTLRVEMNTPKMLEVLIIRRWIEYAFEHGDKTYLDFVSQPFKQEPMNYQKSNHDNANYTCSNYERVQERVKYDTSDGSEQQSERKASLIQGLPEN